MNTSNHPINQSTDDQGNPVWRVGNKSFKSLQEAKNYQRELEEAERTVPLPLLPLLLPVPESVPFKHPPGPGTTEEPTPEAEPPEEVEVQPPIDDQPK